MEPTQFPCSQENQSLNPSKAIVASAIRTAFTELAPANADEALNKLTADDLFKLLERPPENAAADLALPCFRFARFFGQKPPDFASSLAAALNKKSEIQKNNSWIQSASSASAFLNISISPALLAQSVLPDVLAGSFFTRAQQRPLPASTRVMIEYSQPNTHKEFHVGHARNVCLGDSLVRLFRYSGYPVVAANYLGDEGVHIAKCLWFILKNNLTAPKENRGEWLGVQYAKASNLLAETPAGPERERMDREVSDTLRAIESKEGPIYALWQETRAWSLADFEAIYSWFGNKFDRIFYESEVSEDSQKLVDEYLKRGVFVESEGAIGADLKPFKLGFMIVRKRDGNTNYGTKDLVLARRKFEESKIARNIYVVGDEQNHHFKQVFKTLELMGFEQAKQCFHCSYGMVVLPDGKMSSRNGTSVTFADLRANMLVALGEHLEKYRGEWPDSEIADAAHKLCNGALRYGMLSCDPVSQVVFDMNSWLSFEGNSGPYLMYSYTRTQSILRKAEASNTGGISDSAKIASLAQLKDPSEHELVKAITDFNEIVVSSTEAYRPSTLATHLFYMCKSFNRFYTDMPVLKADDALTRSARLMLTEAFGSTLKHGLDLLGMTPPQRM